MVLTEMSFAFNKMVGFLLSPIFICLVVLASGMAFALLRHRRMAIVLFLAAFSWLWIWSTPWLYMFLASGLEDEYPPILAEDAPNADAIVLLGGSMGARTNLYPYAEMWSSADRVWHAARLFNTGKYSRVIASGGNEMNSSVKLLQDFGVPITNIIVECAARNTEENARNIQELLSSGNDNHKPVILLVTSVWHMRRAMLMFAKFAPEIDAIPMATDYEALVRFGRKSGFRIRDLRPDAEMLAQNSYLMKEYIGYWGYRLFR